jgi:hypothetical protein
MLNENETNKDMMRPLQIGKQELTSYLARVNPHYPNLYYHILSGTCHLSHSFDDTYVLNCAPITILPCSIVT